MSEKKKLYECKYCYEEFESQEKLDEHENDGCYLLVIKDFEIYPIDRPIYIPWKDPRILNKNHPEHEERINRLFNAFEKGKKLNPEMRKAAQIGRKMAEEIKKSKWYVS